jgi:tyrosinase
MIELKLSRRGLLASAGAGALIAAVPGLAQAQAAVIQTRYDVATASGQTMLQSYANAVAAMKKLDPPVDAQGIPSGPCNPLGWFFQSFIHAIPEFPLNAANSPGLQNGSKKFIDRVNKIYGNPPSGSKEAGWKKAALACWSGCPHGNSNFVSWHRWYVYYFEQVCRTMSGNSAFTLPYWNYGSNTSTSLQLPAAFQNPSSPLYQSQRGMGFANGAGTGQRNVPMNSNGYMPFVQTDYNPALSTNLLFASDDQYATPPSQIYNGFGFSGRGTVTLTGWRPKCVLWRDDQTCA